MALLGGDDGWAPGKLSAVVDAFRANTEVLADGSQRSELLREQPRFRLNSVAGARAFRLRRSFLGSSRMAIRSETLRRIGTVPEALAFEMHSAKDHHREIRSIA